MLAYAECNFVGLPSKDAYGSLYRMQTWYGQQNKLIRMQQQDMTCRRSLKTAYNTFDSALPLLLLFSNLPDIITAATAFQQPASATAP